MNFTSGGKYSEAGDIYTDLTFYFNKKEISGCFIESCELGDTCGSTLTQSGVTFSPVDPWVVMLK